MPTPSERRYYVSVDDQGRRHLTQLGEDAESILFETCPIGLVDQLYEWRQWQRALTELLGMDADQLDGNIAEHDRTIRVQTFREAAEAISHTRCGVDTTCHEADVTRLHAMADAEER